MAAMAAAITRPMITATPAIYTAATATRRPPTRPTATRATATIDRTVGTMSDTATVMVTGRIGGTATECTAATIIGIGEPENGLGRLWRLGPSAPAPRAVATTRRTVARYRPARLSRNTPCSPNIFQNHQGRFSGTGRPKLSSATARSILTPI